MSNEQWKERGYCNKCRRQKYCNKPCKANKTRVKAELTQDILEKTHLGIAFEAMMRRR